MRLRKLRPGAYDNQSLETALRADDPMASKADDAVQADMVFLKRQLADLVMDVFQKCCDVLEHKLPKGGYLDD